MAKKKKYFVVPLQLDALVVNSGLPVVWPNTDYSHLPFRDHNHKIHHSWKPYLHETVQSGHFGHDTLTKGIHLHWKFPIEFTSGIMDANVGGNNHKATLKFPPLPDRWLIKKKTSTTIHNIWYLESNALHKSVPFHQIGLTTTIPFDDVDQPFRFMGNFHQIFPTAAAASNPTEYLDSLTAELAGDQTFTSLYQNCRTVFGFHDSELSSNIEYEVAGWYSESKKEVEARKYLKERGINKVAKSDELNYDSIFQNNLLFYSSVEIKTTTDPIVPKKPDNIGIGWTGLQAFAALIANNDDNLERSLEEALLMQKFANSKLDREDLFDQAFHEKGFSAVPGGHIWELGIISKKKSSPIIGQTEEHNSFEVIGIPESYAHILNELNFFQHDFDKELISYGDIRDQLFADWHKYMEASHYKHFYDSSELSHNGIPWEVSAKMERTFHSDNLLGFTRKSSEYVWADDTLTEKLKLPNPKDIEMYFRDIYFELLDEKIKKLNSTSKKIQSTLTKLEQYQLNYNSGGVMSLGVLPKHLDLEYDYTDASKLIKSPNYTVKSQDPTTSGLDYVSLDGDLQKLTVSGINEGILSVSCWVKIDSNSAGSDGVFFQIEKNPGTEISPFEIGSRWSSFYINGIRLDPYRNVTWKDIPKGKWIHFYGLLNEQTTRGDAVLFDAIAGSIMKLRFWNRALSEEEIFCDTNMLVLNELKISTSKGSRYWQPNNPVVLIEGDIARSKSRKSIFAYNKEQNVNIALLMQCVQTCNEITKLDFPDLKLGSAYKGDMNPWNPIMLEWQVQNNSISHLINTENYKQSSITNHYQLDNQGPDFSLENGASKLNTIHSNIISGSTILSPHAKKKFQYEKENINTRLSEISTTISDLNKIKKAGAGNSHLDEILLDSAQVKNDLTAIANIFPSFDSKHFLSQALDGYNNALLMRNHSPQLKVMDPLSDGSRKAFIEKLNYYLNEANTLIGESGHWSPLPETAFIPITTGTVGIDTLRMIDAFGRFTDINGDDVPTAYSRTFRSVGNDRLIPARISQPSRLQFRWMSANYNEVQMNDHPAFSPICGWLLPNNFSQNIDVYDSYGSILGILNYAGGKPVWEAAPGNNNVVALHQISNKHLQQTVKTLLLSDASFIELLDITLEKIDPESFAQHLDLAILVGRPIAIVRASVKYELRGLPAIVQDWQSFIDDVHEYKPRSTRAFEEVKIPVRIGEPGRLNDGVLGYWKDSEGSNTFFSVMDSGAKVPNVEFHSKLKPNLEVSHSDPREDLTLLFDPRGIAHAACGVVPVKAIRIPDHMFKPALKNLNIPFFIRPWLNASDTVALPLPVEDGYNWSWLVKEKNKWKEISTIGTIHKEEFTRQFQNGEDIWSELLKLNWLKEINSYQAFVNPKEERMGIPSSKIKAQESRIQQLIDAGRITEPELKAVFSGSTRAVEGWIQLNKIDNQN